MNNDNSFEKPLVPEDESRLFEVIANSAKDSHERVEAENELTTHNLRLVAFIARKYASAQNEIDELISIGTIGLIKAVRTFKPLKNIKLSTYASSCIENEIRMHMRSIKRRDKEMSLQEPVSVDREGNEISLVDIIASDADDIVDRVELKMQSKSLQDNICILDERERTVIKMRYFTDHPQREIAALLDISRSYVSRIAYCK